MSETPVIKILLVSDLADSTAFISKIGDSRAADIFEQHDRLARDLLRKFSGIEIDKTDGFLMLFERPIDAVDYALSYQRGLKSLSESIGMALQSRVGIHLGEVILRKNSTEDVSRGAKPLEIEGLSKSTAARIMSLAQPRQILLSSGAFNLARRALAGHEVNRGHLQWLAHGPYRLKGVKEPINIFEVGEENLAVLQAPPDSEKAWRADDHRQVLGWRPAQYQPVPGRPNWELVERLGTGGFGEVWMAQHTTTKAPRVFKFCYDANRLQGLQREVALFRILREGLGDRNDIASIIDWNFEEKPYFLEMEYTDGGSLQRWIEEQGGPANIPLPLRLELVAQIAEALAAAHSVGILHKDIKPGNILIRKSIDGKPKVRLTDFGIGMTMDRDRLNSEALDLGRLPDNMQSSTSGPIYMAPEILEGKLATVQADIYSLGVILFQLLVEDLNRAVAPGWYRLIDDELLRDDLEHMLDMSPERRPGDGLHVAQNLRNLEQRWEERNRQKKMEQDAVEAKVALERNSRRRKILTIALAIVFLFSVSMTYQARRIALEAKRAKAARVRSDNLISFMLDDLYHSLKPLGRLDLLGDVSNAAMDHYASMDRNSMNDEDLGKQGLILGNIGQVMSFQGKLDKAIEAHRQALNIHQDLYLRNPRYPDWAEYLVDDCVNLARTLSIQGESPEIEDLLKRASDLVEKQKKQQPESRFLLELESMVQSVQGDRFYSQDKPQEALACYERASEIDRSFLAGTEKPDNDAIWNAVLGLSQIADIQLMLGKAEDAILTYTKAIQTGKPMGENFEWMDLKATLQLGIIDCHFLMNDFMPAKSLILTALKTYQDLSQRDPTNIVHRARIASLKTRLCETELWTEKPGSIPKTCQEAVDEAKETFDQDQTDLEFLTTYCDALEVYSKLAYRAGEKEKAKSAMDRAIELGEKGFPSGKILAEDANYLADLLVEQADLAKKLGDRERAEKIASKALTLLKPYYSDHSQPGFCVTMTSIYLLLGDKKEAQASYARIPDIFRQEMDFRDLLKRNGPL